MHITVIATTTLFWSENLLYNLVEGSFRANFANNFIFFITSSNYIINIFNFVQLVLKYRSESFTKKLR